MTNKQILEEGDTVYVEDGVIIKEEKKKKLAMPYIGKGLPNTQTK